MSGNKFEGDNFSIKPERADTVPEVTEEGVVTGEIGGEVSEPVDPNAELLRSIENEARQDAMLAAAFDAAEGDPQERAGSVLDRLNEMRHELDRSDADPSFKRDRDRWLSGLANRLRGLL